MVTKKFSVKLIKVSNSDLRFLYNLLKERDSRVNISHRMMPTFNEHVKFVLSKPYSNWYVIKYGQKKVGSCYITHLNEIGIHIKKEMQGKNIQQEVLQIIMKKNPKQRYIANVNPSNKKAIRFFKNNGFKLIQYTYELWKQD